MVGWVFGGNGLIYWKVELCTIELVGADCIEEGKRVSIVFFLIGWESWWVERI